MELAVQQRTLFGRAAKALREQGLIPAELYGQGIANEHLAVSLREFDAIFRKAGESSMITLVVGAEKRPVLIHDVLYHPLTDAVVAVDFYQVRLDRKIRVKVPLTFTGEAPAVKEGGGVLVKSAQELDVEGFPASIPRGIAVDIRELRAIGQSLYVRNLTLPEGVRVMVDPATVVVSVIAKLTEEEEQAMATQVDVETVKSEAEEKKAERAATTEVKSETGETKPAPETSSKK